MTQSLCKRYMAWKQLFTATAYPECNVTYFITNPALAFSNFILILRQFPALIYSPPLNLITI